MKSLADVARRAGVSKATASRALNNTGYVAGQTRARVQQAAVDLGYVASTNASSLVTGRTRNVGVVTPYIGRWFFTEVIDGIEESLLRAGYDLTLYGLRSDPEQRQRVFDYFLVRKRVDAVIAVGMELERDDMRSLVSLRKPLVGVGGELADTTTVRIDDVAAAALATRHLIELGHTDLVHMGGQLAGELPWGVHGKRLHGFRSAVSDAGSGPRPVDYVPSALTLQDGYNSALRLLTDGEPPTGIVAASDELAFGAMLAARELGIEIPAQLSIVGIDGHPHGEVFGLTTVAQDPFAQGSIAAAIILDLLSGTRVDGTVQIDLPLELTVRRSTAMPRGSL